jgi:hypothetical protein
MQHKTDVHGIYKDTTNGALINKDNKALQAYKMRKKKEMKIDQIEVELTGLKNDMQEIKELLRGLVK